LGLAGDRLFAIDANRKMIVAFHMETRRGR